MQDYMYSVIGLIAIAIHLIINVKVMFRPNNNNGQKAFGKYRFLMLPSWHIMSPTSCGASWPD